MNRVLACVLLCRKNLALEKLPWSRYIEALEIQL